MSKPFAIVLGAAVWPGGAASPTLRRRAAAAARLYHAGRVAAIVATGGPGRHPPAEAEVLRRLLRAEGVPAAAVIVEDRSHSTRENLAFAKALMPPGAPAVIVSDAWHLPRARLIAARQGLTARGQSCGRDGATFGGTLKAGLREAGALAWELLRPMR